MPAAFFDGLLARELLAPSSNGGNVSLISPYALAFHGSARWMGLLQPDILCMESIASSIHVAGGSSDGNRRPGILLGAARSALRGTLNERRIYSP
jgi:hypothetical protein